MLRGLVGGVMPPALGALIGLPFFVSIVGVPPSEYPAETWALVVAAFLLSIVCSMALGRAAGFVFCLALLAAQGLALSESIPGLRSGAGALTLLLAISTVLLPSRLGGLLGVAAAAIGLVATRSMAAFLAIVFAVGTVRACVLFVPKYVRTVTQPLRLLRGQGMRLVSFAFLFVALALTFSWLYFVLHITNPSSFANLDAVTKEGGSLYSVLLYQAVLVLCTFDPPYQPITPQAMIVVGLESVTSVALIAFYVSLMLQALEPRGGSVQTPTTRI